MTGKRPLIITNHARIRYMQRVSQPQHYHHVKWCVLDEERCRTCGQLAANAWRLVCIAGRHMDAEITRKIMRAIETDSKVTNQAFIEAATNWFPDKRMEFFRDGTTVFVLVREDQRPPLLATVLTVDMLDGFVIGKADDLGKVFDRWKFEMRMRGQTREIRDLDQKGPSPRP